MEEENLAPLRRYERSILKHHAFQLVSAMKEDLARRLAAELEPIARREGMERALEPEVLGQAFWRAIDAIRPAP